MTNFISAIVLMTPSLSLAEAQASMKPLSDFANNKTVGSFKYALSANNVTTIPSFYTFFKGAGDGLQDANGVAVAMASRLVPSRMFEPANQANMTQALYSILEGIETNDNDPALPLFICITAPSNYQVPAGDQPGAPGHSAVTPAWRSATWHVVHTRTWDPTDPTAGGAGSVSKAFALAHNAMNPLRAMTPDGGAYQNEADAFEPDPIGSYWGQDNYNRLLALKQQMDPNNVLTNHQAVGWDSTNPRYGCYPADPNSSS